jgi:hypothetical protein
MFPIQSDLTVYCNGLRAVGSRGLGAVGSCIPHHIHVLRCPPYYHPPLPSSYHITVHHTIVLAHKVVLEGVGLPLGLGAAVVYT